MNPILIPIIGILLFMLVCFIIRKKDIDLPGYDRTENGLFLVMVLGGCIAWPLSLPIVAVVLIGLVIAGKHKDE